MNWEMALNTAEAGTASSSPPDDLPTMISARDLQHQIFPPVSWVVKDMLPEGITLFAGKPKIGKSWLALQIGYGIALGGEVLGRPVEQGSVLYAALEDNDRRLKARMERIASPGSTWPDRLCFSTNWPRLDAGGLDQFQSWIDSKPDPRLLIVDTLATVRPTTGGRENQYQSDYNAIRGLHAFSPFRCPATVAQDNTLSIRPRRRIAVSVFSVQIGSRTRKTCCTVMSATSILPSAGSA